MRREEVMAIIQTVASGRQTKAEDSAIAADLVRLGVLEADVPSVMAEVTHGLKRGVSLGFTGNAHQPTPHDSPLVLAAITEGKKRFHRASARAWIRPMFFLLIATTAVASAIFYFR